MSKKLQKRVNGGLAIYFGIGSLISAVLLFIVLLVQAYKAIFLGDNYSWDIFLFVIFAILLSSGLTYALLRVGYKEVEN